MNCSTCNDKLKPVVALDIDGTLARWMEHFVEVFLRDWLPPHEWINIPTDARKGWDGSGELSDHLEMDKHTYRQAKLAFRQGGYKRFMSAYTGAQELASALRSAGAEIWITTTRPWLSLDNIDPDTRHWLARTGIEYDHLLFGEDKYQDLLERVDPQRIVMVLDDELENIYRCKELGLPAVMRINRFNMIRHVPFGPAVYNLQEARAIALERIGMFDALAR